MGSFEAGRDRFVRTPSGEWYDTWTGSYHSEALSYESLSQYQGTVSPQRYAISAGRTENVAASGTGNFKETRTSTIEVKNEGTPRKIRKTDVPADVEQLPEEIKIISEERIGDKHRMRAHDWLGELKIEGYFLESEEGEYDRRVAYVNEARTARQLAAVMDDLPPPPAQKKYHGTMAPGADEVHVGKWLKDNRKVIIALISFPASVLFTALSALIFLSGHHTVGKWVAGVILILVGLVWFGTTWVYCDPTRSSV